MKTLTFPDIAPLSETQKKQLERLQSELDKASVDNTVTVAYSGGLDSRFLAFCAKNFGFKVRLLHVAGSHIAAQESQEAVDFARRMGLVCEVVHLKLPTPQELAAAQKRRCYVCKSAIFSQLKALALGGKLCDGTNASDALVFRPGAQALKELGIYSPLQAAGFAKADIRATGKLLGFDSPEQMARPCLLTRFPYGVEPTPEKLSVIAQVESWIDAHEKANPLRVRLRYPDGRLPELHIEKASLAGRSQDDLHRLKVQLVGEFSPALDGLKVRVLDRLSGFYDTNPEGSKIQNN